jgi:hypothetical protein
MHFSRAKATVGTVGATIRPYGTLIECPVSSTLYGRMVRQRSLKNILGDDAKKYYPRS